MSKSATTAPTTTTGLAFLLSGQVQGVKMRRYVESAARYFGLNGYVINIVETGDVFGEAWVPANWSAAVAEPQPHRAPQLEQFHKWVRGQLEPRLYNNIKPTPIGTAYPAKALVSRCVTLPLQGTDINHRVMDRFETFTMVRCHEEAEFIAAERIAVHMHLRSDALPMCAWPEPSD